MIEILDELGLLASPRLELSTLTMAGIACGTSARDNLPRARITEVTLSPIVHRFVGGTARASEYYDANDRRLPLDEVIDSVLDAAGVIHFADYTSYRIIDGVVCGFALYGADRGHLNHFAFLRRYEDFLAMFGTPDRVEENRVFGDLLGYHHYYRHQDCKRLAYWDSQDESGAGQLSLVNLVIGEYAEKRSVR